MKRRKLEVNISSCAKKKDKKEELNKLPEEITVLFIPTTPDEKLTKILMKEEEKIRILMPGKTRFIERAGNKILHQLTMTKPWDKKTCSRRSCLTCAGDDKGKCRSTNILYQNTCMVCKNNGKKTIYIGESGRSNHERQKEHLNDWRTADQGSHMNSHLQDHHPEVIMPA